jgi:hypothetical protein
MQLIKYTAGALCALAMTATALAGNAIDLIGTWKGVSNTAVIGTDQHHDSSEKNNIQFFNNEFTIVIDQVKGRNFSGYLTTKNHKENLVGALKADMKRGVFVDTDGTATFEMVSQDVLELCYAHPTSADRKSSVAACTEYKRQ